MKPTILNYLSDTYLLESKGKVISLGLNDVGNFVILDQTIFYPQGGGQPCDKGVIQTKDGRAFLVNSVKMNPEGIVYHYGDWVESDHVFDEESSVFLEVGKNNRLMNSQLHTAGHLLDATVQSLNLPLRGIKGFHFLEGAYVEFDGVLEADLDLDQIITDIEKKALDFISQDLEVEAVNLSPEEATQKGLTAPEGKSVRLVRIGDIHEVGCGGTHVKNLAELPPLIIRKTKSKKGKTKISYELKDLS